MLMVPLGAIGEGEPETRRRAALNTIGPVWDANEVWLITAGAAVVAGVPHWDGGVFLGVYLPLLGLLFGIIPRLVGIEGRGGAEKKPPRGWGGGRGGWGGGGA